MARQIQKPRILMITARADIGGGPRHVFDLADSLKGELHLFISSPNEAPYAEKFRAISEDFFEIPKRRFSLPVALRLLSFCRRHRIQLIHSHGRGAGSYSRFLGLCGFRVIHTFHGFHVQRGLRAKAILWAERLLALVTTRFIAVSQGEYDRVLAHHVARSKATVLIFNGISNSPRPNSSEADRRPPLVFGTLTRFDPQKGNDVLVDFIAKLPPALRKQTIFQLAGEGPELPRIRAAIEWADLGATIFLPGPTPTPDSFLANIDVFVSASRGEGLSYATLETLRAGRPMLLSRVTGHTELEGIPGVLFFGLDDAEEFTRQLEKLLLHFPAPTALPDRFTLTTMAQQTLNLYLSLL